MQSDNSDNSPVEIEVQAPQALQTQITPYRRKWGEENKHRVMDSLTFKDKDIEDIAFSAVIYVSGSMFCSSLLSQTANIITGIFAIAMTLVGIIAWWLIKVVPESTPLVIARIFLIAVGLTLGVAL